MNSIGRIFRLTTWGESHGICIGGVIDGVPSNIPLSVESIQKNLDLRRPGKTPLTSARKEQDHLEILSGFFEGKTTGAPLAFLIRNQDVRSEDYEDLRYVFRPGHADYVYSMKYGHRDHRGGGRASARETALRVVAGSIAEQILKIYIPSILIHCYVIQIGKLKTEKRDFEFAQNNELCCPDKDFFDLWKTELSQARDAHKSLGAILEICIENIPVGLGEPIYGKLDSDLASAFMSINAVKGVEFGNGFSCADADQSYDEMGLDDEGKIVFYSNHAGGILAGISTGQPIISRIAFKAPSSTNTPRKTLTDQLKPTIISVSGRHDPCVGSRAVPIVRAMACLVLLDHIMMKNAMITK